MKIHEQLLKWMIPFTLTPMLIILSISLVLLSIDYEGFIWLVIALNLMVMVMFLFYAVIYIISVVLGELKEWFYGGGGECQSDLS